MKGLTTAALLVILLAITLGLMHRSASRKAGGDESAPDALVATGGPVLVELFTSEGCSSCPPADANLIRLQEQPEGNIDIIALSEHVDYWNHLGWKDPFSSAQFSGRQSAYSDHFGGNSIYTPQMVVDGQDEFVGSDIGAAREAIAKAASKPKAHVVIEQTDGPKEAGAVQVSVHLEQLPATASGPIDVLLAVAENGLRSSVRRGENSGRTLLHSSVVRRLESVGSFDPGANSNFSTQHLVRIDGSWNHAQLKVVAIAQERASLHVIGVSSATLSAKGAQP